MTWAALLVALALNSGTSFAYVWLLEASFGGTLDKAMAGIRVTRTNGRNAFAASAIRNLLRRVDGLGFYLVGVLVASCSRFRQRLGDICAGTAVVEAEFGFALKTVAILPAQQCSWELAGLSLASVQRTTQRTVLAI